MVAQSSTWIDRIGAVNDMSLTLDLTVEDRRTDRVFTVLTLEADEGEVDISGASLELKTHRDELLGPRMMLPISGSLSGTLVNRVELRAHSSIPRGSRVHCNIWWEGEQLHVVVPVDPCTDLESHMRGSRLIDSAQPDEDAILSLSQDEVSLLSLHFPWVEGFRQPHDSSDLDLADELTVEEPIDDITDEIVDHLNLADEDAELLKALLNEVDDDSF